MGLLFSESSGSSAGGDFKTKAEEAWLSELGCKACSLNYTPGKIDATGAKSPEIYILGEAAGAQEEEERRQFVGKAGQLLRDLFPERLDVRGLRWNNVLNCHPPKNRDPSPQELACCRPRVVTDIERSKPRVVWGFGNVPLHWVAGVSGIKNWRGRRMPVRIGTHTCWYYPFMHPSFLLRPGGTWAVGGDGDSFKSEEERITWLDLKRAFSEVSDLPEPVVHTPEMAKANVECIRGDIGRIRQALTWASKQPSVGYDYETNRLRPYEEGAKILSLAVGTLDRAFSFPIEHREAGYTKAELAEVKELVRRFLLNASCVKRVHNLAFELEWSGWEFGADTLRARPWEDTSNNAAILDERGGGKRTRAGPFSLEFLVQLTFGFNIKRVSNVDRKNLEFAPLDSVLPYNGIDAKYHEGLGAAQMVEIDRLGLREPWRLAQRCVPTVVLSQLKGVPIDQPTALGLRAKYGEKVSASESSIASLDVIKRFTRQSGLEFNPFSPKHLQTVFEDILRCREVQVEVGYGDNKTRKFSTEETVLDAIIKNRSETSDARKLARRLIELREASGTKSKYVDALVRGEETCVVFPDGLVHCNYNTYVAETGRLSCDDPNLQNFPKRDAGTKEVRRSLKAAPGDVILSFDYGQIEARVIAMFTRDPVFVKALWERFDVHQDWAERIAWEYPARVGGRQTLIDCKAKVKSALKVMKDFRTDIKNQWTFPLFFGAKDTSVANYLGIPIDTIRPMTRQFWKMFEGVKTWQEELVEFYQEHGYVECLTGRRRRGPLTINQVINSPVQGTAAEIVKDAMSRLSETRVPVLQPELNIHDDLTFVRVPKREADDVAERIIDTMLKVPFKWVNVPITVEMSYGPNWCDLEEIKDADGKTISVYSSDQW